MIRRRRKKRGRIAGGSAIVKCALACAQLSANYGRFRGSMRAFFHHCLLSLIDEKHVKRACASSVRSLARSLLAARLRRINQPLAHADERCLLVLGERPASTRARIRSKISVSRCQRAPPIFHSEEHKNARFSIKRFLLSAVADSKLLEHQFACTNYKIWRLLLQTKHATDIFFRHSRIDG